MFTRFSYKRFCTVVIIFAFVNLALSGCYSVREVSIYDDLSVKIYKVETLDGKIIEFENTKLGYAVISGNEIVSFRINEETEKFQLSDIAKYYTEKFSVGKTVGVVLLIPVTFAVILFALLVISMEGRDFGG